MRGPVLAALAAAALLFITPVLAQEPPTPGERLPKESWSFTGVFGSPDLAAAQRGFWVYYKVCSTCHSMQQLHYRDLAGIGLSAADIKAVAASVQVPKGVNDQGQPVEGPATPADQFRSPFPNQAAAKATFGGAVPPDLSLIANALPPDFIYGILTGFTNAPPRTKVPAGRYYNAYFPSHLIAMPPPLHDDVVSFADGTKATVPQMAHDVVTFLYWAANPDVVQRKQMGVRVVLFLLLMMGLTYAMKRKVWSDVH